MTQVPELVVVIDTEEEFDWGQPFSRSNIGTGHIPAQARAQEIFERVGLVPTYVVGYPVASDPVASGYLRGLMERGVAEIGAHLHPWVTPPHREAVTTQNSYECNLPPRLERAKIDVLTEQIERAFGRRPTVFKAGRHGFGPATARSLAELGYRVDCSLLPHSDLRSDGGPNFLRVPDQPHWLPLAPDLLEVPVTTGYIGSLARLGDAVPWLFDSPAAVKLKVSGLLSRTGLLARSRLTPEGVSAAEQCRLVEQLVRRGRRTFCLVYHSPSLEPGHTPYVRDEAGLERFLGAIEQVVTWFRDTLGGRYTTMGEIHARMAEERQAMPVARAGRRTRSRAPRPVGA